MMKNLGEFKDTGKRMLIAWNEGVNLLRQSRMYGPGTWKSSEAFKGISEPPKLENPKIVIGRSELLAHRGKSAEPKQKPKKKPKR
jgi:serine/threonine-protein kinase HipA